MDATNFSRIDMYCNNDSCTIFTGYGEGNDQAGGRPNCNPSEKSLTMTKKILYCFTKKIAITIVLLITLCFLNITEDDIVINIPILYIEDSFVVSYNHLRISFSFINSFFLTLSLVFTFAGYYTGAPDLFKFQQCYILIEILLYLVLSFFIFCCYMLDRSELNYVLKELQHFFGFYFLFTMGPRIIMSLWIYYVLDSNIFNNP